MIFLDNPCRGRMLASTGRSLLTMNSCRTQFLILFYSGWSAKHTGLAKRSRSSASVSNRRAENSDAFIFAAFNTSFCKRDRWQRDSFSQKHPKLSRWRRLTAARSSITCLHSGAFIWLLYWLLNTAKLIFSCRYRAKRSALGDNRGSQRSK